ncbi:MAG: precorrin-2 C(20)-methyltransferase [Caloramator sp.]|nr:precorrin-2 C(20)-methyltransferase [Caloramator sp.]
MKKFYGIGIGPGDPELLTLKALRIIKESDIIFVPSSKGKSLAKDIVKEYLAGKRVVELNFPMGKENKINYKQAAEVIYKAFNEVDVACFLTLGDPLTYSTFIYLYQEISKYGIYVEIIPGITSYNAAFSRIKMPFAVKNESILITDKNIDLDEINYIDKIIFLKANNKKDIIKKLNQRGFKSYYVKRCFLEGEEVLMDEEKIKKDEDYLSILISIKE